MNCNIMKKKCAYSIATVSCIDVMIKNTLCSSHILHTWRWKEKTFTTSCCILLVKETSGYAFIYKCKTYYYYSRVVHSLTRSLIHCMWSYETFIRHICFLPKKEIKTFHRCVVGCNRIWEKLRGRWNFHKYWKNSEKFIIMHAHKHKMIHNF
jgi:hypothetical protein